MVVSELQADQDCSIMQVHATVFKDLIELYPKAQERNKLISKEKHEIVSKYLAKHEKLKRLRVANLIESSPGADIDLKNLSL